MSEEKENEYLEDEEGGEGLLEEAGEESPEEEAVEPELLGEEGEEAETTSRKKKSVGGKRKAQHTLPEKARKEAEARASEDVEAAKEFFERYGKLLAFAAVLAIAAAVGLGVYRNNQSNIQRVANSQLQSAKTVAELQMVANSYPELPEGQLALHRLAQTNFANKDYDKALEQFRSLATRASDEPYGPMAKIGELFCLEEKGELEQAKAGYQSFAADNPEHYLAPKAIFGYARVLALEGKFGEAKAVYEKFLDDNVVSDWNPIAERMVKLMDREARAAAAKS